ncbi:hypothetical protein TNCV_1132631 [Trichonephila clavipes]|nr:hypothetical protein TNCV_1132631 [Trichonephila clavipes]
MKAPQKFIFERKKRKQRQKFIKPIAKPLNLNLFNGNKWTYQQDSANARKAKTTQRRLVENTSDFIEHAIAFFLKKRKDECFHEGSECFNR